MNNIIAISTGLVYKLADDRNEMIRMLKEFKPQGIELNFYHPNVLKDFKIAEDNLEYLRSLEYVSIHAPWVDIRYGDNADCRSLMDDIGKLYHLVGARNVTLHPTEVDDYAIFFDYDFKVSIENEDWKKDKFKTPFEIKKILDANPNLGFTFDFAHALTVDSNYIDAFIRFPQISQIHLSYHSRALSDHRYLSKHMSAEISEKLLTLPSDKPIVLESTARDRQDLKFVDEEINLARNCLAVSALISS